MGSWLAPAGVALGLGAVWGEWRGGLAFVGSGGFGAAVVWLLVAVWGVVACRRVVPAVCRVAAPGLLGGLGWRFLFLGCCWPPCRCVVHHPASSLCPVR